MKDFMESAREHHLRLLAVVALIAVALLGIHRYSNASAARVQGVAAAPSGATTGPAPAPSPAPAAAAPADGGTVGTSGGVQAVSVDLSSGSYNPDVINLKAGVPVEITFGQGSGCLGTVQSSDLGFQADLSGGPQTVKLPALKAGTYGFACGMGMVTGQIVVS